MLSNNDAHLQSSDSVPMLPVGQQEESLEATSTNTRPTQKFLWRFIARNRQIPCSFVAGLTCCLGSFFFTWWLSTQIFQCPEWALGCQVGSSAATFSRNLGAVQGIVTAVYGLGLAGLTFNAYTLSETAVWPLLRQHSYNRLDQLDAYLSASRGSLASLLLTYAAIRNSATLVLVVCLSITSITPLVSSPVVGWVYNKQNVTADFKSSYGAGGGLEMRFAQSNPTSPLPMPVVYASELYNAWSRQIAEDPMPEARDYILDRLKLSKIGNFSVHAVRAHKDIHCTGRAVNISDTGSDSIIMAKLTGNMTSKHVELRLQPKLTLWVDDVQYKSEDRAVSTLVFAVFNSTIDKGTHNAPTERMVSKGINGLSAVSCSVDVTLEDRVFTLGDGNPKHVGIASRLRDLVTPTKHSRTELAVWLGVAPVAFGISVNGMQPNFEREGKWLRTFAWSSSTPLPDETYDIKLIENFIRVSSGALAQGMSQKVYRIAAANRALNTTVHSKLATLQLENSRSFYLLILPGILMVMIVILAIWDESMYRKTELPEMRLAGVGELIKSAQTADMRAMVDAQTAEVSRLGKARVQYVKLSGAGDD